MRASAVALLVLLAAAGCGEAPADDDFGALAGGDEKSDLFSSRMRLLGALTYGAPAVAVEHPGSPRYVGFRIDGRAGDELGVEVRSSDARPRAWLLDARFAVLASGTAVVGDDDARLSLRATLSASGRHYLALRDSDDQPARFTVTLQGRSSALACAVAGRDYASRDAEICKAVVFRCASTLRAFNDDCGCGCEPIAR